MLVYKGKWISKRLSQMDQKIAFTSSEEKIATEAMDTLIKLYGNCALEEADVIRLVVMVSCCKPFIIHKIYQHLFME